MLFCQMVAVRLVDFLYILSFLFEHGRNVVKQEDGCGRANIEMSSFTEEQRQHPACLAS